MNWDDMNIYDDQLEEAPKKKRGRKTKRYVAVVGINFDKFNARIEAGQEIPPEFLQDKATFNWLLNRRKAIREVQ